MNNIVQLSPCICSKVRFALGLKNSRSISSKRCSKDYWNKSIDFVVANSRDHLAEGIIQKARDLHRELMAN